MIWWRLAAISSWSSDYAASPLLVRWPKDRFLLYPERRKRDEKNGMLWFEEDLRYLWKTGLLRKDLLPSLVSPGYFSSLVSRRIQQTGDLPSSTERFSWTFCDACRM